MKNARLCSVPECSRKHDSHGLCGMHAARVRRGRPLSQGRPSRLEYFQRRILKTESCWLWQGKVNNSGYGSFSVDSLLAHRFAYESWVGPTPEGLHVDHLCRVKLCVNPDHLEAVTPLENCRRKELALGIGSAKTHCPHGHAYDEENTYHHPTGRRYCRACARIRAARKSRERKK